MPLIDKPLQELFSYQGINPRPADFDEYWNSSLKELGSIDPQVELVPNAAIAPLTVECFDLWFTGIGGARVYAKFLRPKLPPTRLPAVLWFHGYGGHSGEWYEKLALASQGFCVAALDCRGQGGRSEDNSVVKGTTFR